MSDPLIRGAVVACGRRFSVVWEVREAELVLLPVIMPRKPYRHDVELVLADLVAGGIAMARCVVRPRRGSPVPRADWRHVGELPGATMCRLVHALVRGVAEDAEHAKWVDERTQRARAAADPCVDLTKA